MNERWDRAIAWLGRAIDKVNSIRKKARRRIVKIRKYLKDLRDLEQEVGPEADANEKILKAAEANEGVTLTPLETRYKAKEILLFRKYIREPLDKLK